MLLLRVVCPCLSTLPLSPRPLQDLDDMFGAFGRIVEIRVNRDKLTGRCKGFGFVAMSREEEVDAVSIFGEGGGEETRMHGMEWEDAVRWGGGGGKKGVG